MSFSFSWKGFRKSPLRLFLLSVTIPLFGEVGSKRVVHLHACKVGKEATSAHRAEEGIVTGSSYVLQSACVYCGRFCIRLSIQQRRERSGRSLYEGCSTGASPARPLPPPAPPPPSLSSSFVDSSCSQLSAVASRRHALSRHFSLSPLPSRLSLFSQGNDGDGERDLVTSSLAASSLSQSISSTKHDKPPWYLHHRPPALSSTASSKSFSPTVSETTISSSTPVSQPRPAPHGSSFSSSSLHLPQSFFSSTSLPASSSSSSAPVSSSTPALSQQQSQTPTTTVSSSPTSLLPREILTGSSFSPSPKSSVISLESLSSSSSSNDKKSLSSLSLSTVTSPSVALRELSPSAQLRHSDFLASQLLPSHPYAVQGVLSENGLEYFILPHAHPPGSLEVHMEVHAGSTSEGDHERGMAHLCEHVSYMGSRKRERLINLQAETNAYTDFHHTVFFAAWRGGDHEEHAAEGDLPDEAETAEGRIGQKGQQGRQAVQRGRKRDDEGLSWTNSRRYDEGSPPSQSQLTKKRLQLALEAMKEVLEVRSNREERERDQEARWRS